MEQQIQVVVQVVQQDMELVYTDKVVIVAVQE
jgi:hypothetical protein